MDRSKILLIFVDGLGIGPEEPALNPVYSGAAPFLVELFEKRCRPIDPCLGVPGIPQSATGQTALLTGVNAARIMGRHVEGFPGGSLKKIIREKNIFSHFIHSGKKAAFANAYYFRTADEVGNMRAQSVTTVAALAAFGDVRKADALERNMAVYQDLTRESLVARGYRGPIITPVEAAGHLVAIACENDFTLFEYFQTDRAGHSGDAVFVREKLSQLDRFLAAVFAQGNKAGLKMAVTSDHGNIEDISARGHTINPVPFITDGMEKEPDVDDLTGVTPFLCRLGGI